jgi:hypothetical protein
VCEACTTHHAAGQGRAGQGRAGQGKRDRVRPGRLAATAGRSRSAMRCSPGLGTGSKVGADMAATLAGKGKDQVKMRGAGGHALRPSRPPDAVPSRAAGSSHDGCPGERRSAGDLGQAAGSRPAQGEARCHGGRHRGDDRADRRYAQATSCPARPPAPSARSSQAGALGRAGPPSAGPRHRRGRG